MTRRQPTVRLRSPVRAVTVFRKMVGRVDDEARPGDVVRVEERNGRFAAQALWNPRSTIALRVLSRRERPVIDDDWFARRIESAVRLRREALRLDRTTNAYRVVNAEGDGLPGLIVDRYADVASCVVSSLGVHRRFAVIRETLNRTLGVKVVHVSAAPKVAKLEGFVVPAGAGAAARTVIREGGIDFEVDCAEGHKTGLFLDQREGRRGVRVAAGGRRVLDLFGYTGGFALNAARGGAREVVTVDLDEAATAGAVRNAARNDLDVRAVHDDAFRVLREIEPGRFDLFVVDPAKQGVGRRESGRAMQSYFDLNRLVFSRALDGALVVTCSCTGAVSRHEFRRVIRDAAAAAGREIQVLEDAGAPPDHPVALEHPAGRYLKRIVCRVLEG